MFNIRGYGIVIQHNRVLVSIELIGGKEITKFPGGGLTWGEGLAECVKREFLEENGLHVNTGECFYVTDFFVPSAFNAKQQVISCYFFTTVAEGQEIPLQQTQNTQPGGATWHRLAWVDLNLINADMFYFPIDKKVAEMLRQKFS
jgi:8-oxo-dGTP diphosphatase